MVDCRINRILWVIVALLLALAVAGCGDDTGDAAPDASTSVGSGSGNLVDGAGDGAGSNDVPANTNFPIPAPDGLVLDALVDAGLDIPSQRQLLYANDDFDLIAAFYDEWTSQNGEWSRGESEGTVVFQRIDGESIQMITVSPDHDPGAQADGPVTLVVLTAG